MAEGTNNRIGVVLQAKLNEEQAITTIQQQLNSIQNKFKKLEIKVDFNTDGLTGINDVIAQMTKNQQSKQKQLTEQRIADEQRVATTQQKNADKLQQKIKQIYAVGSGPTNQLSGYMEELDKQTGKVVEQRIQRAAKQEAQLRDALKLLASGSYNGEYANVNAVLKQAYDQQMKQYQQRQQQETRLATQQEATLNRLYQQDYQNQVRLAQQREAQELAVARTRERAMLDAENTISRFRRQYAGTDYNEAELRRILNIEERINTARRQGGNIQQNLNHQLQLMRREMTQFESAVRASQIQMRGLNSQSVSLLGSIKSFVQFYVIGDIFMQAERAVRSMYTTVRDLDTSMMELKKITSETAETYERFLDKAAKKAADLGSTTKDVVDATAEFARTGASFAKSQELAESAIIYTKVSQNATAEDAAAVLISTMAAFEKQGLKSIDVVDKLNNVSNKYSITNEGLGEALKRSASAMQEANNTLDETIALITAANTISQDPELVGIRKTYIL